jgi:hypothetical protein
VVVDRLTKMVHFIPCTKTITREETVKLFLDNICHIHGLPNDIILDMGFNLLPISGEAFFNYLE